MRRGLRLAAHQLATYQLAVRQLPLARRSGWARQAEEGVGMTVLRKFTVFPSSR
ncbi:MULTISPECIES: hypothetical protein [Streptomyces]|uniref:Uncharacterized protein n=1 Tax=Streptomyces siderophoricus TaxID=2802281 RepID=A0ABS1MW19_9ACTN|nr:hypothetical protein [Streptomyces sp. 9-7]MBL1091982.1 hypothetical protein [Streptomyces sp. 9-7]